MLGSLRVRRRQPEWLDQFDADPVEIQNSLRYIRKVNRALGYTQVILKHLERFSANWKRGQTIRIVDIGTGSADIPVAILRWADQMGWILKVVGVDLHPTVVREAGAVQEGRLAIVRGNAMNLPFADESFDYAITSMFIHHLDECDVVKTLSEMGRVASRGIIVSDLMRLHWSYLVISALTLFSTPMVKHDARVSVAQSFTKPEILAIREQAGVHFADFHVHLRHRLVLAGEKMK